MRSSLVRVLVNNGKSIKYFNVDALTGRFFDRLLKLPAIKNLEVSDPDLEANLTEDELRRMREKFPYLAPRVRKAEPLPLVTDQEREAVNKDVYSALEIPETATIVFDHGLNDGLKETDTKEQPQAAKRGRKPKQA